MQVDLNEQELDKIIMLVTEDMVAETRSQPPGADFRASLAQLAQKLHQARNKEIERINSR